ncbi:MAG: carbon monoxide dehydrogenase [Rhizobiales bacterium]|mgnify:CR=1 FL=1|nr:carbon monoxide dehydrogenase [Hyphomicrobiales bacterium]|tara:strand:+ start:1419 stop:1892 length:474 start_codon:yes stop_codon:yes gene_type:complete
MELKNTHEINAPRETVWALLHDTDVLQACIPGCEELTKTSDSEMQAKVKLKIGPVKAAFKGKVFFENVDAPKSLTLSGEGNGGIAGHARGGADVVLEETAAGTRLTYEASAQVGGKIAQLGGRLIQSTASKLAADFFSRFEAEAARLAANPETEPAG